MTPSHQDFDEPLLNPVDADSKDTTNLGPKVALNADMGDEADADIVLSDEENADNFVMAAMLKKKKSAVNDGRRDSALTVNDDEADADRVSSDEDSFGTDSSGDSILDESYDDLDESDIALQNQIMTNFVAMYRRNNQDGSRSFLIRQETKFTTFSPTNAGGGAEENGSDKETKLIQKQKTKVEYKEVEVNSDTESELSDNDMTPKGYKNVRQSYRPESKVIDYDDINL